VKFENGHHVLAEELTEESYHELCQKIKNQDFHDGGPVFDWMCYDYVGISDGRICHGGSFVFGKTEMLLTTDQALDEENKGVCHYPVKHKDLFDAIVELRVIKNQIAKLQEREAELSKFIADDLELG